MLNQYHEMAINILERGEFSIYGEKTMLREPGYPFFLAVIYKIFGMNIWVVKIIQFLLHFLIIVGVYFISTKLFNILVSVLSSLAVLLYPIFNIFSGIFLSEMLATFFEYFF